MELLSSPVCITGLRVMQMTEIPYPCLPPAAAWLELSLLHLFALFECFTQS
jgi:hypothetical protein